MFVSDLLTQEDPRDPALIQVANSFHQRFEALIAETCASRDQKAIKAAALTFWSILHGFALLRMGKRLMPFMLGQKKTNELLFTGDSISAEEAHRCGLVNRVVEPADLESAVEELVRKIAPTPLPILRLTKLALVRAYEAMGLRSAVAANLDLSAILNAADTPEQREFDRIVGEQGLKAALKWRDSRYGELGDKQK